MFALASAGLAQGIGHGPLNLEGAAKHLAHGISQGAISEAAGGDFKSGFAGAFVGSSLENVDLGLPDDARVVNAAIVGGTASALSGGSFGNGAVSAAFVEMFNRQGLGKQREQLTDDERAAYLWAQGVEGDDIVEVQVTINNPDPEEWDKIVTLLPSNVPRNRAVVMGVPGKFMGYRSKFQRMLTVDHVALKATDFSERAKSVVREVLINQGKAALAKKFGKGAANWARNHELIQPVIPSNRSISGKYDIIEFYIEQSGM